MGTGLPPSRTRLGSLRDRVLGGASSRLLGHYALPTLNALRADLGLSPLRVLWDQVHAARREYVLTARAFDLPRGLRPGVRYVGPMLEDPSWAVGGAGGDRAVDPSADEARPDGPSAGGSSADGLPLVLVALSSTFQDQRDCLQRSIDALATLPVRALVTTGKGVDPGELRAASGIEVVRSAPHGPVMARAPLVLTHGGHGTVMKALATDLPLVVMPHSATSPTTPCACACTGPGSRSPAARPQSGSRRRCRRSSAIRPTGALPRRSGLGSVRRSPAAA